MKLYPVIALAALLSGVAGQGIDVLEPDNQSYSSQPDYNFTNTSSSNLTSVNFSIDSASNISTSRSGQYFSNSSHDVSEGSHDLRVYGSNESGEILGESLSFTYDSTPPQVNLLELPSDPVSEFEVNATYSDSLSGIGSTYFNVTNSSGTVFAGSFNSTVSNLSTGSYNISYTVKDGAGNSKTNFTAANVSVDSSAPSLEILSPESDEIVSGFFGINTTYSDENTVESAMYEVSDYSGTVNASFNSSKLSDGGHTLKVNATDSAGNTADGSVDFDVDNHPPRVSKIEADGDELESGDRLSSNLTIEASFSDEGSKVNTSLFRFVNDSGSTGDFESGNFDVGLSEGLYNLTFSLMDASGNWNNSSYVQNLEVDSTAPSVELGSLPEEWVREDVRVELQCSGEEEETVEGAVYTGSEYLSAWEDVPRNVTVGVSGNSSIEFRCRDGLGNTASLKRNLAIDKEKPEIQSLDPLDSGERVDTSFEASINFSDELSGVRPGSGNFWISGKKEGEAGDVSWSGSVASFRISGLLKSSQYDLKGYVLDMAGNNLSISREFKTERLPEDIRGAEIIRETMSLGAAQFDLVDIGDNSKVVMNISDSSLSSILIVTDAKVDRNSVTVTETSSPGEVQGPRAGEPFRYFAARPERSLDLETLRLRVEVPRSWLNSTGANSSSLVLKKLEGSNWTSVNTTVVREDGQKAVIEASPDSFSRYVVLAEGSDSGGLGLALTSGFLEGFQDPQNWISAFLIGGILISAAYLTEELGYIDIGLVERFQSHF
ncbi:MAG: Ig-like domain-containing protein [Candidatus Nanohaloarchaea archaeon]